MKRGNTETNHLIADPAWTAAVVAEVIARLKADSGSPAGTMSIDQRIVTAETIARIEGAPTRLLVPTDAVVTPAARDEAKNRGIQIDPATEPSDTHTPQEPKNLTQKIVDSQQSGRAAAIARQLAGRGVDRLDSTVVLSDTPAKEVCRQCRDGGRAVMIRSVGEVDRFAAELEPTVWVIDMDRTSLVAATNIVARIAQRNH